MTSTPDSPSAALNGLLANALDRSIDTSLTSLDELRIAVGNYTRHQKNRGMSLDSIMRALSTVLMQMEDDRVIEDQAPLRDPKLARQLRAWCSEDFSGVA
jgi:hypothetical protein